MAEKQKWLQDILKKGNRLLAQMSPYANDVGEHVRGIFGSSPSEILERAGDKGRSMRMRIMQRDLEHQLGRIYIRIGKLACRNISEDKNKKGKHGFSEMMLSEIVTAEDVLKQLDLLRKEAERVSRERTTGAKKQSSQIVKPGLKQKIKRQDVK